MIKKKNESPVAGDSEDFAAESGRGLFLVDSFADGWGWHPLAGFFCSSRRRHTISLCDWSSDVCSSDLADAALGVPHGLIDPRRPVEVDAGAGEIGRGRVGKECRSRWSPYHYKKKKA